jgi:hypothetical protein
VPIGALLAVLLGAPVNGGGVVVALPYPGYE